jgi:hypothetical protein
VNLHDARNDACQDALLLLMVDETPDPKKPRTRSQPPVPLALATFFAAVAGFMVVVAAVFAIARFVQGAR